jgi:hypothetical protein
VRAPHRYGANILAPASRAMVQLVQRAPSLAPAVKLLFARHFLPAGGGGTDLADFAHHFQGHETARLSFEPLLEQCAGLKDEVERKKRLKARLARQDGDYEAPKPPKPRRARPTSLHPNVKWHSTRETWEVVVDKRYCGSSREENKAIAMADGKRAELGLDAIAAAAGGAAAEGLPPAGAAAAAAAAAAAPAQVPVHGSPVAAAAVDALGGDSSTSAPAQVHGSPVASVVSDSTSPRMGGGGGGSAAADPRPAKHAGGDGGGAAADPRPAKHAGGALYGAL